MKDFLGEALAIGDEVVFVLQGYREFRRGTIYAFTPKNVRIKYHGFAEILQHPTQVIKVIQHGGSREEQQ